LFALNWKNIEYQHEVDINLCYAHAYKLYLNGFRHRFNQEEIKRWMQIMNSIN
jgi:hypothetical protein